MKTISLILLLFLCFHCGQSQEVSSPEKITLVIHGGAGTIERHSMTPEMEKSYRGKLEEALRVGYSVLDSGGTSIEAVIATIKILEDSPLFNAGKGAVYTNEETVELDAAIMDGKDRNAGAVASIKTVKNPIEAAWEVMVNSNHVMLAGKGAESFARERGLPVVEPTYFFNQKRLDQLKKIKENQKGYMAPDIYDRKFGTVGAVALDRFGNIAAGTSTGGMSNKKWGRIGDSPIIGAGTYAENETCGVSATGHGEFFIRYQVAYDIAALMKYKGLSLSDAANEVIMNTLVKAKGDGGVVALDKDGNIAMPFNTSGMYRGFIKYKQEPKVLIYKDEK